MATDLVNSRSNGYDAVVIGAGVIGAATAFELGRRGRRVLCVDKLPAAGFGSTVNSCAIVRFTYSTYTGVAMAYEGLQYWLQWPAYLEAPDELGLIEYKQCGMATLKDPGGHYLKVLPHFDAAGVAYEEWSTDELIRRMPTTRGCSARQSGPRTPTSGQTPPRSCPERCSPPRRAM